MRKRTADWGRDGLDERFGEAWQRFAPMVERWVDVAVSDGPEALRDAWLEVLARPSDAADGSRAAALTRRGPGGRRGAASGRSVHDAPGAASTDPPEVAR